MATKIVIAVAAIPARTDIATASVMARAVAQATALHRRTATVAVRPEEEKITIRLDMAAAMAAPVPAAAWTRVAGKARITHVTRAQRAMVRPVLQAVRVLQATDLRVPARMVDLALTEGLALQGVQVHTRAHPDRWAVHPAPVRATAAHQAATAAKVGATKAVRDHRARAMVAPVLRMADQAHPEAATRATTTRIVTTMATLMVAGTKMKTVVFLSAQAIR